MKDRIHKANFLMNSKLIDSDLFDNELDDELDEYPEIN